MDDLAEPYRTARDLPSYREMEGTLAALGVAGWFMGAEKRREIRQLKADVQALLDSVDEFYRVLGPRHWIYHNNLNVTEVTKLLEEAASPADAEERFIDLQEARLRDHIWMSGLKVDGLTQRWRQVERARQHYLDGHYDSCALVLVTVMDGYVNDFDPSVRRGLHARTEENEMFSWNSATGHHMGLTNVMPVFLKSFKKRQEDEVFELHRHGIVHGNLTNYNNRIVAMKAWNMLHAVVDWVRSTNEAAKPQEPKPTLGSTFDALQRHVHRKRAAEEFEPYVLAAEDDGFAENDLVNRASTFFEAWEKQQWGRLIDLVPPVIAKQPKGQAIDLLKVQLGRLPLTAWQIDEAAFIQVAVAEVRGTATVGNVTGALKVRWCQFDESDTIDLTPGPHSRWRIAVWTPDRYVAAPEQEQ